MTPSLIPERPLIISPTLAATIGLHEAVMLQALADLMHQRPGTDRQQRHWVEIADSQLADALPFWTGGEIDNVSRILMTLGLLLREPVSGQRDCYRYAINQQTPSPNAAPEGRAPVPAAPTDAPVYQDARGASHMEGGWRPGSEWIKQCRQHGIPEDFISAQVPAFVQYWRDRGSAQFSWGNKFYKQVLREWHHQQSRQGARDSTLAMDADWWPSEDALEILEYAGIKREFVEDAVPEFILYWRERDARAGAWNTKFIDHVRRQWARFSACFGIDDVPRPITEGWQPSAECFDILQLAEIDEDYARSKVAEFVLYWRDSGQARASWNTVFLQFIKQDWARRLQALRGPDMSHAENRHLADANRQQLEEKFQRFADRSWAE